MKHLTRNRDLWGSSVPFGASRLQYGQTQKATNSPDPLAADADGDIASWTPDQLHKINGILGSGIGGPAPTADTAPTDARLEDKFTPLQRSNGAKVHTEGAGVEAIGRLFGEQRNTGAHLKIGLFGRC